MGSRVLENNEVGRLEIVEAALAETVAHPPPHLLEWHAKQRPDERRPNRGLRRGRFGKAT